LSTDTFTREIPSKNKGIETPKPVTKAAVKRKNNSWFILDSNRLAVSSHAGSVADTDRSRGYVEKATKNNKTRHYKTSDKHIHISSS
jgi:hypothetical protein